MFKFVRNSLGLALFSLVGVVNAHEFHEHEEEALNSITKIELTDQFGQKQVVDDATKILIFAHDMAGSEIVEQALEQFDADNLATINAVYLADISGMPSLIASLFAIPSMRDRAYPIMLDKEGDVSKMLRVKEEQVTVIFLDSLAIQKVRFAASAAELTKELIK